VIGMMVAGLGPAGGGAGQAKNTVAALGAAAGAAIAGAIVWGLIALLLHKQLSLIGLVIGLAVGWLVARLRPGHLPTIVAGAIIAVAGCALGTLLGQIFLLLNAQVSLSVILAHLNLVLRAYPANVGALGVLFYALAAYGAVRRPLQQRKLAADPPAGTGPGPEQAPSPDS
jgi:hypothetical protein